MLNRILKTPSLETISSPRTFLAFPFRQLASLLWLLCLYVFIVDFSYAEDKPSYGGPKHVVAVLPFDNKVKGYDSASSALGEGMTEILTTELVNSGRFVVIERALIQDIVKEQELSMTGLVNSETAVKAGGMAGAQFFIKGAVTEFNPKAGGGGISLGWDLGKVASKASSVYLAIDVRIIDNATGHIYASYNASATAKSRGARVSSALTDSIDNLSIGVSGFSSTAIGQAVRTAIQEVMGFIEKEATEIPWQGSIIKSDGRRVFVNRGSGANVKRGDAFYVYAKGEPLIDPDTGFNLGTDEEYLCEVQVSSVKPKFSIANVTDGCAGKLFNRGDIIRYE